MQFAKRVRIPALTRFRSNHGLCGNYPVNPTAPLFANHYCNFTYSALACFRIGMSGSAFFQRVLDFTGYPVNQACEDASNNPMRSGSARLALPHILAACAANCIGRKLLFHLLPTDWTCFTPHKILTTEQEHSSDHSVQRNIFIENIERRTPPLGQGMQFVRIRLIEFSKQQLRTPTVLDVWLRSGPGNRTMAASTHMDGYRLVSTANRTHLTIGHIRRDE